MDLNKKIFFIATLSLALVLVTFAAYSAKTAPGGSESGASVSSAGSGNSGLQARQVIGFQVRNEEDQYLGRVQDLIIDQQTGKVVFAVVSQPGILGFQGKWVAVPFDSFSSSQKKGVLLLHVDREKFMEAPTHEARHIPDLNDRTWVASVYRYFNETPFWEKTC